MSSSGSTAALEAASVEPAVALIAMLARRRTSFTSTASISCRLPDLAWPLPALMRASSRSFCQYLPRNCGMRAVPSQSKAKTTRSRSLLSVMLPSTKAIRRTSAGESKFAPRVLEICRMCTSLFANSSQADVCSVSFARMREMFVISSTWLVKSAMIRVSAFSLSSWTKFLYWWLARLRSVAVIWIRSCASLELPVSWSLPISLKSTPTAPSLEMSFWFASSFDTFLRTPTT
mmetsp:Transcript_17327/g.52012  ORF Transcript_17327/g.52012 Transcript_17327/m.52012 type:complete len:232 (+) Transcript_17327:817-1512(+)